MKTIAGDRILIEEGQLLGSWTAACGGCGWIYGSLSGVAGYYSRTDVTTAARLHASECIGDQGALW
ncbi:hypothetical protein [Nocardioides luteus]|uniref:hypothetical protein n=1 Tax=Nocardioides luteus TaxID=1844 RepID=UPI0018C9ED78|nr:hypothetical protein [Nocardioides luteus]MBG6098319.1 hypothetical protein [Nocardioides luteus]